MQGATGEQSSAEPAESETVTTDRFMAIAAHDLRNPLAVMRASAQMALRQMKKGDQEAASRRMQAIVDHSDRLSEVLEAFVDAARVEANALPLRPEPTDLSEVVAGAVQRARIMVGDYASREVEVDVPEGFVGSWDRARVGRAVRALVENAFLYGATEEPVRIRGVRENSMVRLSFSGGGPGPEPEEADRLFGRFFRGHAAAEAGHSGSGLGLYTARGIARAHGGDVRRSDSGAPDQFELELPLSSGA